MDDLSVLQSTDPSKWGSDPLRLQILFYIRLCHYVLILNEV